jgi:hypothetical protein
VFGLGYLATAANAQTLSHTTSTTTIPCVISQHDIEQLTLTIYSWSVEDSKGTHTFSGSTETEPFCRGVGGSTSLEEWSTDSLYHLHATGGSGSIDGVGTQGFVNPKYVVVGITYAPPGSGSNVTYGNTTTVGNTTMIGSSFQSGTSVSVSVSGSLGIPLGKTLASGGISLTFSSTTDYTQSSNSSNTTTISKATAITYKTNGYPTPVPTSPPNIVSSDYDVIWLWLNPLIVFTADPAVDSSPAALINQGYAFDPNDPAGTGGPDVYPVQVGYLNGHFTDDPSIDAVLARTWTSPDNLQWPAGEGPGLTATDKATIVALDPFTNPNYTGLSGLPSTSADGRFTQGPFPPNPLPFVPGVTTTYNTTQTNTQTTSQGASNTFQQAFGVSESFGTNFFDIFSSTTTIKETQTFTWTHTSLNSLTTTTAISDGLTIAGVAYSGPTEFIYYQDNLFGTFAFPPS